MRTSISFYDKELLRCDFFSSLSVCRSVPLRSECSTPCIMTLIASPPVLFCHTCAKEWKKTPIKKVFPAGSSGNKYPSRKKKKERDLEQPKRLPLLRPNCVVLFCAVQVCLHCGLQSVNGTLFYGSRLITANRERKNKRNNRNKCSWGAPGEPLRPFIIYCSRVNQPTWQRGV